MKPILVVVIALSLTGLFFSGCKKECPGTIAVDAGPAQSIALPLDSVTLMGTATSGATDQMNYLWTELSGPDTFIIAHNNLPSVVVNNLDTGIYIFQFKATNSNGLTAIDTVSVFVSTIKLAPSKNPLEGRTDNINNTFGDAYDFLITSWTVGGVPSNTRSYLEFDQRSIPAGAIITSAKLYLFQTAYPTAGPNGPGGYATADNSGTANAYHIRRVTSAWSPSTMTFLTQPSNTLIDEVIVPQTNHAFQNDTLDVSQLVRDMQANTNYGFEFGLENEIYYNTRAYASSLDPNPALHPRLVIVYH
jgi:K319-like protein